MFVGQAQNKEQEVMYGCYIVGRLWYFMVLRGREFAISKDYSATHEDDILKIVKILKGLRDLLLVRIGVTCNVAVQFAVSEQLHALEQKCLSFQQRQKTACSKVG